MNPDRRAFLAACCAPALPAIADDDPIRRPRRVWLRRLAESVRKSQRADRPLTDKQKYFAGLTRISFLYVDHDANDIILEGPSEDNWRVESGRPIGSKTAAPLLQLDDFAVAWRNGVQQAPPPSVSLEIRKEARLRVQQLIRQLGLPKTADQADQMEQQLEKVWGDQDALTRGVSHESQFNKVMLDADWEMKRVSLGHSNSGVKAFDSYVDLEFEEFQREVVRKRGRVNRLPGSSRFWFYPAYEEFLQSNEADAIAIPEKAVQLLTESYFLKVSGERKAVGKSTAAAVEFSKSFSDRFAEFAAANPLYAHLRQLFDWVAAVRLIQLLEIPDRIGWNLGFFNHELKLVEIDHPRTRPGLVTVRQELVEISKRVRASIALPARGGVSVDLSRSLPGRLRRVSGLAGGRARAVRTRRPGWWWS